jgi:type I restriction enzyme S subunit
MELKPRYKQTEVGVIPEDWELAQLGDLLTGSPTYGINAPAIPYDTRYATYLRITDITEDGRFDTSSKASVDHPITDNYRMEDGDLVFARTGASVGKSYLYEPKDGELVFAGFLIRVRPDPNKLCPQYLKHFAFSLPYWNWVSVNSMRSGQPGINGREYASLLLPLPPTKAEQDAIAEALSDADALIESLEQLIAKKRQIKQGAMQELLTGEKRLPGFSGEWEVRTFGEIFAYLSTATNSRSDLIEDGDAYYIHYGDIHTKFHNHLDFATAKPPMIDRTRCRNAAIIKNGDWVMADASEDYDGVGKTIEITGLGEGQKAVAGLHTFLLREKSSTFVPGFKGHLGGLKSLHEEYLRVATGMKVYGVSKAALVNLELPVPNPDEQTAIAAILSDMDTEINALETKLTKSRQMKQGIMQELLTGNIRLA